MNRLSFEDLMELFSDAKKERNFDEITKINKEFERRVKKRKLMGKKPVRTSLSGLNQTSEWLNNNSELEYLSNQIIVYIVQIFDYITYQTDQKPYPFSALPSKAGNKTKAKSKK